MLTQEQIRFATAWVSDEDCGLKRYVIRSLDYGGNLPVAVVQSLRVALEMAEMLLAFKWANDLGCRNCPFGNYDGCHFGKAPLCVGGGLFIHAAEWLAAYRERSDK